MPTPEECEMVARELDRYHGLAVRARAYVRGRDKAADEFPPNAEGAERWSCLRELLLGLADAIETADKEID